MHNTTEIKKNLHWIGGNDRRLHRFENLFPLQFGIAYNSYLWMDEKTALIDTVDQSISQLFLDNVEHVLNGRDLDYLVVNHMEPDHCGNVEAILRRYPMCKFVGNARTFQFFQQFYDFDASYAYMEVKDGDTLTIGQHTLKFYMAQMVHWPEVMMTLETTEHVLFTSDAYGTFGAHYGSLFADQIDYRRNHIDEARRYYANIIGRFGGPVQTIMRKLSNDVIKMICPLHGPIYRESTELALILDKYEKWSNYEPEVNSVLLIYGTMYNNTELVVDTLATKLSDRGVREMRIYDVSEFDLSYLIADVWKYSHIVLASPTYNTGTFFLIHNLLHELVHLNLTNRKFSLIVNQSWGGQALQQMKEMVSKMRNVEIIGEPLMIQSTVKDVNLPQIEKLADEIAASVHASKQKNPA